MGYFEFFVIASKAKALSWGAIIKSVAVMVFFARLGVLYLLMCSLGAMGTIKSLALPGDELQLERPLRLG